ncbi:hypothetical protein P153DRAFT_426952 [Dothidotthia symphoricarpi CBS 119687]|uniref:Uncharacterized protein n=1 Tax=Dothidotthia symphoricarpi CBS 119687 TaxID=1392245 RepID=A0A6A5ZWZ5_9PLEO|nr:uncharacterized protein P153DRAFT_426952 [Dothidotthia symphoricarpi CBS 119687]KAF2123545.1 hypothetical protein P153DRAFT_426952 [Dothidotthia symphoricarpi CBS 119687]
MSLQLHIHTSQECRPSSKGRSRNLVRFSEPPDSPAGQENLCEALETDGRPCNFLLPSEGHTWCPRHARDLRDLSARWKQLEHDAERVEVVNSNTAQHKVVKLQSTVELRRRIRERFHTRGVDTTDYTQWIAKVERDTRALADSILKYNMKHRPTPEVPGNTTPHPSRTRSQDIMILQSPLDPRIPIGSLNGIPDDGSILILKNFSTDLCDEAIRRLYSIVPDLNDARRRCDSPMKGELRSDDGGKIVRSWFRIMVLNHSEAEALEHATRCKSIAEFLAGCQASQIETYCDFFENAWRPHAVQYLRVAICAGLLAGDKIKTIRLLGGVIPSTTDNLHMTKPSWDVLYRWFPTLLTPGTVASICSNFEDYTTICKLLMLGLYRDRWYDPASILSECAAGVYMGFLPTSKGDFTDMEQENDYVVQRESRNFLCGQMALGDSLTRDFLTELQKRTDRLYLVVYEGTKADATVHPTEPDIFVSRHRFAQTSEELDTAEWSTSMTLEDVKDRLRRRKASMYDQIVVDSWQFIVIDREVGLPFQLMDIVQDALLMLVGDPSPREIAKHLIQDIIPPFEQGLFLSETTVESSANLRYPAPPEVQYEGNRHRCHDPDSSLIAFHQRKATSEDNSRDTNRFVRRVIEDMERCNIISLVLEHEEPQTRPVVIQGSDGALDLYFPYEDSDPSSNPALPFPPKTSLLDFAHAFKQNHPNAIMAKGSLQTHYCAWPMPAIKSLGRSGSNFVTGEGHIYRWNAMPFDRPSSAHAWQYYIQHYINSKFPFVMFYLSTFVICAVDADDAEHNSATLLEEMEDRGWRITLPRVREWTASVEEMKLEVLFGGVGPA